MIGVFDIIEGPARGKRFWLRDNQQLAVGRISTADFSVPSDAQMSRHHLIFEANLHVIRVRDVGSANGTFVNNARIRNLDLCPGDKIRAGTTTFALTIMDDGADPHREDGIGLTSISAGTVDSAVTVDRAISISQRVIEDPNRNLDVAYETQVAAQSVSAQSTDDAVTMRLHAIWWKSFFEATPDSQCLALKDAGNQKVEHLLKDLSNLFEIAVAVNQTQLTPQAEKDFQALVRTTSVVRLSQTLYLVPYQKTPEFESFCINTSRSDAVIYLGSECPFQPKWFSKVADSLSYPSMLSSLVGSSQLKRLLRHVVFVLYEKDRTGTINVLLGET